MNDMENGPDCLAAQACRGDFYLMLQEAMATAGGHCDLERLRNMPLKEFVDLVAQNGLRVSYMQEKHISQFEGYKLPKNL